MRMWGTGGNVSIGDDVGAKGRIEAVDGKGRRRSMREACTESNNEGRRLGQTPCNPNGRAQRSRDCAEDPHCDGDGGSASQCEVRLEVKASP